MSSSAHDARFSFADYVAFERTSNVKHEFLQGQIYAMAGGTPEHAALSAAVSGLLFGQLRDGNCRIFSSDLRIRAGELVTYPDVTIVCGPPLPDPDDSNTITNPTAIIEATSPSTEQYDRGKKLATYQSIESLRILLLVAHDKPQVDCFLRAEDGWRHDVYTEGSIELAEVKASLVVSDIYRAG